MYLCGPWCVYTTGTWRRCSTSGRELVFSTSSEPVPAACLDPLLKPLDESRSVSVTVTEAFGNGAGADNARTVAALIGCLPLIRSKHHVKAEVPWSAEWLGCLSCSRHHWSARSFL